MFKKNTIRNRVKKVMEERINRAEEANAAEQLAVLDNHVTSVEIITTDYQNRLNALDVEHERVSTEVTEKHVNSVIGIL